MHIEQDHLRHTAGEGDGWVSWSGLATSLGEMTEALVTVVDRLLVASSIEGRGIGR